MLRDESPLVESPRRRCLSCVFNEGVDEVEVDETSDSPRGEKDEDERGASGAGGGIRLSRFPPRRGGVGGGVEELISSGAG